MEKEQLHAEFNELRRNKFDDIQMLAFESHVLETNDYRLYYDYLKYIWDLPDEVKANMHYDTFGGMFYRINDKGVFPFLFEKAQVENEKSRILYLIAQNLSRGNISDCDMYCDRLVILLKELLKSGNMEDRRRGIIALGWVGDDSCISIMTGHMLHDEDALCRAWSASGLMQLSFHRVQKERIIAESESSFLNAIEIESDLFALGVMISAAQVLYSKKWISGAAIDNLDEDKIIKGRKSAVNFLDSVYTRLS